jgi:hypothetical protein
MQYIQEITVVLGCVKREVVLLFKTIEFLKSIEQKFSEPLNTYQYFVGYPISHKQYNYSSKTIRKYQSTRLTRSQRFAEWWTDTKMTLAFLWIRFVLFLKRLFGAHTP